MIKLHLNICACLVFINVAVCRARGTECIQAPEMLLMSAKGKAHDQGCGAPADVWGVGCLLFEICTGTMLFNADVQFDKFYLTVTKEGQVRYTCMTWLSMHRTGLCLVLGISHFSNLLSWGNLCLWERLQSSVSCSGMYHLFLHSCLCV